MSAVRKVDLPEWGDHVWACGRLTNQPDAPPRLCDHRTRAQARACRTQHECERNWAPDHPHRTAPVPRLERERNAS